MVEVTFSELVNGWLRDPVLRQVVAAASGKRSRLHASQPGENGALFQLSSYLITSLTNPKVLTNSCEEADSARLSAVTSSRFAYNSPNAVLLVVMWNTGRVKRSTRDRVQAFVGALSSIVSS